MGSMDVKIDESWKKVLQEEFEKDYFKMLTEFVRGEYQHAIVYPPPKNVFRAFDLCPFDNVRVVILGQDPYHGAGQANGQVRLFAILGQDEEAELDILSTVIAPEYPQYESLTKDLPQAHLFEREIAEQWAITPIGHPWLKPLRYHSNYRSAPDIWTNIADKTIPGEYPFYAVAGEEVHEVGVGPVHAGIIEPGHFRFQCHGEAVMHLEIQLGYQHRGIEGLMAGPDLKRSMLLSESIAGDTAIGHSTAFCEVVESLRGCVISARAQAIRAVA